MERIDLYQLDIPIIRSCNLACVGCLTHPNHKKIKGLVNLDESLGWLEFWSTKLNPDSVNIFGGEPLLHPEFVQWVKEVRRLWGSWPQVKVNTNGYYLDVLINNLEELFNPDINLSVVISIQNTEEPHYSIVKEKAQILKDKIIEYRRSFVNKRPSKVAWKRLDDSCDKLWYTLELAPDIGTNLNYVISEMHQATWCTHYTGHGEFMLPVYNYNDKWYEENHLYCQAKHFTTLYKGDLYKCPPVGVLEHTLTTFNIQSSPSWEPYMNDYKKLTVNSTDEEIQAWALLTKTPEKVCNMCGFSGPYSRDMLPPRSHLLKQNWKIKTS